MARPERRRGWTVAFTALVATMFISLEGHDRSVVGPYRLEIGWDDEPAYAGIRNAIIVELTEAGTGRPVDDLGGGSLVVEVSFGSERVVLPLHQMASRRNELRAFLMPTRAGTYTFHLTGTVKGLSIDMTSTCSEKTFDCVSDASTIQFPAKDPPVGQIVERIDRSLPRAERAEDLATRARTIAIIAVSIAALAQVTFAVFIYRHRKGS